MDAHGQPVSSQTQFAAAYDAGQHTAAQQSGTAEYNYGQYGYQQYAGYDQQAWAHQQQQYAAPQQYQQQQYFPPPDQPGSEHAGQQPQQFVPPQEQQLAPPALREQQPPDHAGQHPQMQPQPPPDGQAWQGADSSAQQAADTSELSSAAPPGSVEVQQGMPPSNQPAQQARHVAHDTLQHQAVFADPGVNQGVDQTQSAPADDPAASASDAAHSTGSAAQADAAPSGEQQPGQQWQQPQPPWQLQQQHQSHAAWQAQQSEAPNASGPGGLAAPSNDAAAAASCSQPAQQLQGEVADEPPPPLPPADPDAAPPPPSDDAGPPVHGQPDSGALQNGAVFAAPQPWASGAAPHGYQHAEQQQHHWQAPPDAPAGAAPVPSAAVSAAPAAPAAHLQQDWYTHQHQWPQQQGAYQQWGGQNAQWQQWQQQQQYGWQQQWSQQQGAYQQPAWGGYGTAYQQPYQQHPYQQGVWPAAAYSSATPTAQQYAVPHSTAAAAPATAAWQQPPSAAAAVPSSAPTAAVAAGGAPVATAAGLFQEPGRSQRPSRFAVLLRGPPGSGKSTAACKIREAEAAAGAPAPRTHSIDDYFVTEVDKEVEDEKRKGKKRTITEMEYLFEPELEAAYEKSLLKAFGRTLEEKRFSLVLVDAPMLKAADLQAYWRSAQAAGFEVYVAQPLEMDPQVCAERNIHKRSLEDCQAAAAALEPPPSGFLQLDLSDLFGSRQADDGGVATPTASKGSSIAEFDMEAGSDGGGSSDDDTAMQPAKTSRWGSLEGDGEEATPGRQNKKRRRTDGGASPDAAAMDGFKTPPATLPNKNGRLRGILSTGGGGSAQRVRWADESADGGAAGFSVGGSKEQLEQVFVLEGLGPPMEDSQRAELSSKSFEDSVRGEHNSEQKVFRDLLFGGRRGS